VCIYDYVFILMVLSPRFVPQHTSLPGVIDYMFSEFWTASTKHVVLHMHHRVVTAAYISQEATVNFLTHAQGQERDSEAK